MMGRHKLKVADVAKDAKLNRSTVTALYNETAKRIELDAINELCKLFKCEVSDLLEFLPDEN